MIERSELFVSPSRLVISIRSLRAQHDGAEMLVGIQLESGENTEQRSLPITTEQYCDLKLQRGVITEETYEAIEEASQLCMALRCGENLLAYGANTEQALARKIAQRGFSREISIRAAHRLCEIGLIDEKRDLRREVEKCLRKLWGAKRISAHLWSRGFSAESMRELDPLLEEIDFVAACAAMIQKHYGTPPTDPDDARRMVASLSRYGYSVAEIKGAISLLREV